MIYLSKKGGNQLMLNKRKFACAHYGGVIAGTGSGSLPFSYIGYASAHIRNGTPDYSQDKTSSVYAAPRRTPPKPQLQNPQLHRQNPQQHSLQRPKAPTNSGYTIGSAAGQSIATNMPAGGSYKASDGSTWTKDSSGNLTVKTEWRNIQPG